MMTSLTRRQLLQRGSHGFGWLALNAMLTGTARAAKPHFKPRAQSVILLFMDGGVSQVDSFDPKPLLAKENGKPFRMKIEATQFDANGNVLASPWKFKQHGASGIPVSELFPHTASVIDDICVVRSMKVDFPE